MKIGRGKEFKQYEVYWIYLNPTIGAEIKKVRPCVVVSPSEMNEFLSTIIIAPITSSIRNYPTRIDIELSGKRGQIILDQLKTVDKIRFKKRIGRIDIESIIKIKAIIKEMLVD